MLADVLPYLRCPVCAGSLAEAGRSLRCGHGHSFDLARQGYLHLGRGRLTHPGDTTSMVAARAEFLGTRCYQFLVDALAAAVPDRSGLVLDVGGGTGHHLAGVLDAHPAAIGLVVDVSKPALRRAARTHSRAAAVLADAWQPLPLIDGAATALLNVFAPRNGAEFRRVLAPDGTLLVVTPAPDHLAELAPTLGEVAGVRLLQVDPEKPKRVSAALAPWFQPAGQTLHTRRLSLTHTQLRALVEMSPSAAHTDPAALAAAIAMLPEPVPVTAAVHLTRYHPKITRLASSI